MKSGKVNPGMVQSLLGTIQQNNAAMGIFITLDEPTKAMRGVADQAGNYHSDWTGKDYPRIQILSIADLLERGKHVSMPPSLVPPYPTADKVRPTADQQTVFEE